MSTVTEDIYDFVVTLIADLKENGHGDYSKAKSKMLIDFNCMYDGEWECHTNLTEFGFVNVNYITIVQEDEFDNKSEEEQEEYPEYNVYSGGHYIFLG